MSLAGSRGAVQTRRYEGERGIWNTILLHGKYHRWVADSCFFIQPVSPGTNTQQTYWEFFSDSDGEFYCEFSRHLDSSCLEM